MQSASRLTSGKRSLLFVQLPVTWPTSLPGPLTHDGGGGGAPLFSGSASAAVLKAEPLSSYPRAMRIQ